MMTKKPTPYRGKYPNRIKSVSSIKDQRGVDQRGACRVTTNGGDIHVILASQVTNRKMPVPGEEIGLYVTEPAVAWKDSARVGHRA